MSNDPQEAKRIELIVFCMTAGVLALFIIAGFGLLKLYSWLNTTGFYEFMSRPL